ncbi:hypothetical protein BGZ70_009288 [Mortierella alpina]|uniref:Uncharacterized protein n=1 Tax=Mortierella alpina TaxID=64518 RepID=A0A9P6J4W8_MORAP|nr:hypothetical protein BGZ70_009288 [Mortierella alpina]
MHSTAVLAKDRFDAISSIGYLSGYDVSDPEAHGSDVFYHRKNRVSAVASIVQHLANVSDYRPAEKSLDIDPASFTRFFGKLVQFPAFKKTEHQIVRLSLKGPVDQLVEEIQYILKDVIDPVEDYPVDPQIAENFRRLLPRYLQNKDQNFWLLNQVAIQKVRYFDKLRIELTRVTLWIKENKKTSLAYIPEQEATLSRDVFTVDTEWITEHAEELAKKIETVNVEQALSGLTTKAPRREGFVDDRSLCEMVEEEEEEEEEYAFFGRSRFNLQKLRI